MAGCCQAMSLVKVAEADDSKEDSRIFSWLDR